MPVPSGVVTDPVSFGRPQFASFASDAVKISFSRERILSSPYLTAGAWARDSRTRPTGAAADQQPNKVGARGSRPSDFRAEASSPHYAPIGSLRAQISGKGSDAMPIGVPVGG